LPWQAIILSRAGNLVKEKERALSRESGPHRRKTSHTERSGGTTVILIEVGAAWKFKIGAGLHLLKHGMGNITGCLLGLWSGLTFLKD